MIEPTYRGKKGERRGWEGREGEREVRKGGGEEGKRERLEREERMKEWRKVLAGTLLLSPLLYPPL